MYNLGGYSTNGGYGGQGYSGSSYSMSSGYSSNSNYSNGLDEIVMTSQEAPNVRLSSQNYSGYLVKPTKKYFVADNFLNPLRPETQFIGNMGQVKEFVEQTFSLVTGESFPDNIQLTICSEEQLRKIHLSLNETWNDGIQGFSINKQGKGINEIFVKQEHLDKLMLTIGHEIGHVMSFTLNDSRDEEAKAFAFSLAWMKMIVENNIAGLKSCINPSPARNGLHNVAFDFVESLINKGRKAIEVFNDLVFGRLSILNRLEVLAYD